MTDRELIELAAKAAGINLFVWGAKGAENFAMMPHGVTWNPLENDADAFRLAVKLEITVSQWECYVEASFLRLVMPIRISIEAGSNRASATRRAITRAAAEIAKERFK